MIHIAYNGEKLDESGNIYLRARYYNPRIGQFVQIDSYRGEQNNSATQQRYTYCANNQYKYVDPNGNALLLGILAFIGITTVVSGTIIGVIGGATYLFNKGINKKKKENKKSGRKYDEIVKETEDKVIPDKSKHSDQKGKTDKDKGKDIKKKKGISSNSSVKKDEPQVCSNEQVNNDTIDNLCDTLEKAYYKKYSDRGVRKAIKKTIDQLRNEGKKKQDYNYVKEKCKQYEFSMPLDPYTSSKGVIYAAKSTISLNGFTVSSAFISDVKGNSFTLNVTEIFPSAGIKVALIQVKVPGITIDKNVKNINLGFELKFVEISTSKMISSFTQLEIGAYIGVGVRYGYTKNTSLGTINLYWSNGAVLGGFIKISNNYLKMATSILGG